MKLPRVDAGLPASTRLWSLPAFTPHRRGWALEGSWTAASRPNAQSGPPPPSPPFPSVSKTSFHRPWSWTPFLLSIAAASWVSPHRSPPRPSPGETSTGAGRGHPQSICGRMAGPRGGRHVPAARGGPAPSLHPPLGTTLIPAAWGGGSLAVHAPSTPRVSWGHAAARSPRGRSAPRTAPEVTCPCTASSLASCSEEKLSYSSSE